MTYSEFIESKRHSHINYGIEVNFIPDMMFEFQKYVSEYAINKGRCALFLDTGLGKTIIELTVAKNYASIGDKKPVLIITPLAVAFQFIKEAKKFNLGSVEYSKDGKFGSSIVICNYERLEHFSPNDFDCVILDESSILKNFDGAIKNRITSFLKKVKYRFLFTATPSPNDYIELGTSSEALGYLGYTDMLTKFFTNKVPVTHLNGLSEYEYFGETPFLPAHIETYGNYEDFKKKWKGFDGDQRENKLSHLMWQRYASSVWDDIRIDNVLPFRDSKEEDDEKHVHPLQLDVIDRLVVLYSNPGELVATPFMGVGSEVYSPVSLGRKGLGVELKESYFKQSKINMQSCSLRFIQNNQLSLI